jgi:hypothetical protein
VILLVFAGIKFDVKYERVLAERVRLNRQILGNPYWYFPFEDKSDNGECFQPNGRGVVTSDACAVHRGFKVCKDVEAHKGVVKGGVDYTGKIVVRHKHWWCNSPTCPKCFIRGHAVRVARGIEKRIDKGVERGFGKPEHVVVSPRLEDYGLREKVLRSKCRDALRRRGVFAGAMIYHHFRIDWERHVLKVGKHYHTIGFVRGGYNRGANNWDNDFEMRTREEFKKDGYIVKVKGERLTVFGTCWYQLHHASVKIGVRRSKQVNWFGEMAYNNFKGGKLDLKAEVKCPVCEGETVDARYDGAEFIPQSIGDVDYKAWFGVDASRSSDFVEFER